MDNPVLWALIGLQVTMGAFDTLVHHEGTERLAWRPSQKTELRLHGVRNAFYALLFLTFGWLEPHGAFAIAFVTILALEVGITLWDFVEEDMTRRLPATERVNHTLLALNYGAILALAAPYLRDWIALPSALVPVSYGWWSVMATASAIGVGVFSLRDLFAAARSDRLDPGDPATLVDALPAGQRVLITGGTGFVGTRLVEAMVAAGHRVTVLTRNLRHAADLPHPVRLITTLDQIPDDEPLDAIVNLAGEPVATGLWTARKRARIVESRTGMAQALGTLLLRLKVQPECVITGSAVGWYGVQGDTVLDETSAAAPAFVHESCDACEKAALRLRRHGPRVVLLRTGLVMGTSGGILARLLTPFEFGLGGRMGDGQHWMSWIALDDMVRVIAFAIADRDLAGPVNAVAPLPVRNAEFTESLAAALRRPAILPIPASLLTLALGDMARELLLGSQRVVPVALQARGFTFRYPTLAPMLRAITGARTEARAAPAARQAVRQG